MECATSQGFLDTLEQAAVRLGLGSSVEASSVSSVEHAALRLGVGVESDFWTGSDFNAEDAFHRYLFTRLGHEMARCSQALCS